MLVILCDTYEDAIETYNDFVPLLEEDGTRIVQKDPYRLYVQVEQNDWDDCYYFTVKAFANLFDQPWNMLVSLEEFFSLIPYPWDYPQE